MRIETFLKCIDLEFFAGVPDSQLKPLCDWLYDQYGVSKQHIIAANEGNAVALAAGYYLATGKTPVVYLQNSGLGNIVNPVVSLLNEQVYGIPCMFIVGWRGEPGLHDEPQHIFQGEITLSLLENLNIPSYVIDKTTTPEQLNSKLDEFRKLFAQGKQAALVIRKGALEYGKKTAYSNAFALTREEAIRRVLEAAGDDPVISTTGKASRELFELRTDHKRDFLTVGSMGHSSSIALGIALSRPNLRIWCIDGDGALLMHMGAMGVIGAQKPRNLVHVVINNGAHESVGGMPTAVRGMDLPRIAKGCGYPYAVRVETAEKLDKALEVVKTRNELCLIEVRCAVGSRADLGRPTTAASENKRLFMEYLASL